MLTIGLLGGMSWESTAEYHRLANTLVRERLGGLRSARLVLVSVDFEDVAALQRAGRWDDAAVLLAAAARQVEAAGADLLLICTSTMHLVADEVQAAVGIPLLHLADVAAAAVLAAGVSTVGLLATAFTMEQPFYRDRLAGHGLTVVVPDADDRALVHQVVFDELCMGVVRAASRQAYVEAAVDLALAGPPGRTRPARLLPDLFHVAVAAEWEAGDYLRSTRGLDLADVGFVHLAFGWQVQGVLDRFYANAGEPLLLLRVDPDLVQAAVAVEPPAGSTEGFPHLYGPLLPASVVEVLPLTGTVSPLP